MPSKLVMRVRFPSPALIVSTPAIPSMLIIIAVEFPIAFALTRVMPYPRARPVGSARPRS